MNVCNLPFKWASSSRPTTVMVQETQQVGTGPAKNALPFSIILLHPVILVAGREEKKKSLMSTLPSAPEAYLDSCKPVTVMFKNSASNQAVHGATWEEDASQREHTR